MEMRDWVFDALLDVVLKGTYSNLYVKDHLDELDEKQRPAATRLFYDTIQNYGLCTYVWSQYADEKKTSPKVQVLLAMTVCQILFMKKVPPYAAVDEAVRIAKKRFGNSTASFVNGVLRNILRNKLKLPEEEKERLAIRYSLPEWLLNLWQAQYGEDIMKSVAQSVNAVLPVYVRPNPNRIDRETFLADSQIEAGPSGLGILTGNVASHPFYRKGQMTVQDEGSHEIAQFMQIEPGDTVLDVCAAPGTKTLDMAEHLETGHIDAVDLHAHRTRLIDTDARRLHLQDKVTTHTADSRDLKQFGTYSKVLCDVPCSGYGVLARKPDMKLKLDPDVIDRLVPVQKAILEEAALHVGAGGSLVYSTCTVNKKENERQVEAFLSTHPEFVLDEEKMIFPTREHNGFYMARLKKEEPCKASTI